MCPDASCWLAHLAAGCRNVATRRRNDALWPVVASCSTQRLCLRARRLICMERHLSVTASGR